MRLDRPSQIILIGAILRSHHDSPSRDALYHVVVASGLDIVLIVPEDLDFPEVVCAFFVSVAGEISLEKGHFDVLGEGEYRTAPPGRLHQTYYSLISPDPCHLLRQRHWSGALARQVS